MEKQKLALNRKYFASICLIIKDEGEYLEEWLEWHSAVGFEHFYIYDNGSSPPIKNYIPKKYVNLCTVVNFDVDSIRVQVDAYTHCLENYGKDSEWIAFIDTDEFIRILDGSSIRDFLGKINGDALEIRWIVYGANGKYKKENLPVKERFKKISHYPEYLPCCKCIVRPSKVKSVAAHGPIQTGKPIEIVNEYGEKVNTIFDRNISCDTIAIDHYFTRSLEEWKEKIYRGSCDSFSSRQYDMFWEINKDMERVE